MKNFLSKYQLVVQLIIGLLVITLLACQTITKIVAGPRAYSLPTPTPNGGGSGKIAFVADLDDSNDREIYTMIGKVISERKASQQSVHPTSGSLRVFQALFWLQVFPAPKPNPSSPTRG